MSERELYRVHLKSVRTAPPGYEIPTCQGTLCRVTTQRLLVPGARYGSETALSQIGSAEAETGGGVWVMASGYSMMLRSNSQQEAEQLAEAIRTACQLQYK